MAPISAVSDVPMGRTWSLTTARGRWLASPVYPWINNEQADRGNKLREAARVAGITSPEPARSAAGRLIETVAGGQWRVLGWMDVGPIPVQPLHSDLARRVGEVLGILHALRIPSETVINPYLTWRRPMPDWAELVERATAAGQDWVVSGLSGLLPTVAELQSVEAEVSSWMAIERELAMCLNSRSVPSQPTSQAGSTGLTTLPVTPLATGKTIRRGSRSLNDGYEISWLTRCPSEN